MLAIGTYKYQTANIIIIDKTNVIYNIYTYAINIQFRAPLVMEIRSDYLWVVMTTLGVTGHFWDTNSVLYPDLCGSYTGGFTL